MGNIDWGEVAVKTLIVLMCAAQIGFVLYASMGMTETEKTDLILMFQQWE